MALRQQTETTNAKFEDEGENVADEAQVTETAQVEQPAQASTSTAVAQVQATPAALAARDILKKGSLSVLKDAFHIEWNSVERILAAQGQFKFKDNDHKLGEEIGITLMSYQDRWVCSPNDDKADKELVKYSDDGFTATDGTDLKEHLAGLKADGYSKAKIEKRMVILGELTSESGKTESERIGSLVQIDLPPTGVGSFNTYLLQAAFALGKERKTFEECQSMKLKAVAMSKPYEFTKIEFVLPK